VARSFLAADRAKSTEIALIFYRKGCNDFYEERYIEALYDFYFMFESLFGCGKTKNAKVAAEFKKSKPFRVALEDILSKKDPIGGFQPSNETTVSFKEAYGGKTIDEVIDFIVDLRGFIHHHTAEKPGIWHPEEHSPYECHAMFFILVAHTVAFREAAQHTFSDQVTQAYQAMHKGASS
jgi:hypothetical protein